MRSKKSINQSSVPQRPQDKSAQNKLQAVVDTINKSESEVGAYCRQHGIHTHHLDEWKKQILESLGVVTTKKHKAENKLVTNEIKQLKRDLHRKDKALAEVSALLILKKKADLLWGDGEDA
jgi:transposase-like protein